MRGINSSSDPHVNPRGLAPYISRPNYSPIFPIIASCGECIVFEKMYRVLMLSSRRGPNLRPLRQAIKKEPNNVMKQASAIYL
jgi:hypothetical protein